MKKVITILITLALLLALAAPACAENKPTAMSVTEETITDIFGENYRITERGRTVMIETWADGMMIDIASAMLGNDSAIKTWDSLLESVAKISENLQELFDADPAEDRIPVFLLVDELSHDTSYLIAVGGQILFDCINSPQLPSPASQQSSAQAPSPAPAGQTDGMTMGQKNAVKKAESYLKYSAFSREGLIEQLEYSGFSHEDSEFAVEHITVDWFEQAVKKAESYLEYTAFSREGLIDQLEYIGFTHEQAEYAAQQVGY